LVSPAQVVADPEFEAMSFPRSADERELLERGLALEGCREALIVWQWRQRLILLVGYDEFRWFQRCGLPFHIVELRLASQEEARQYIIRHHLRQPHLSRLQLSYLRGLRYVAEKKPHGGARSKHFGARTTLGGKTAEALGETYGVSGKTIRRDGELVAAVKLIAANSHNPRVPGLLLGHDARLTHGRVVGLAELEAQRQRELVAVLQSTGKLPRSWRRGGRRPRSHRPRQIGRWR
jgi:hypothetical protein